MTEEAMSEVDFDVLREHQGDKFYRTGDVRTAKESDVTHLVRNGVLQKAGGEKAEPAPANKAEPKVDNKAAAAPKTKGA